MGTVATIGDRARLKIGEITPRFVDENLLGIINTILETIYQSLVSVNSNLVYGVGDVTTTASTAEYTPSFSFDGFLTEGSWVDGEDTYLAQVSEADKIKWDYGSTTSKPEAFYITEDGKIGYLWVPDDAYTIHHTYWKPLTALTVYLTDDLPWGGIWNRVIKRLLIVELLEIVKQPVANQMSLAQTEWDKAMVMVYRRGIRQERQVSDMFSVGGI